MPIIDTNKQNFKFSNYMRIIRNFNNGSKVFMTTEPIIIKNFKCVIPRNNLAYYDKVNNQLFFPIGNIPAYEGKPQKLNNLNSLCFDFLSQRIEKVCISRTTALIYYLYPTAKELGFPKPTKIKISFKSKCDYDALMKQCNRKPKKVNGTPVNRLAYIPQDGYAYYKEEEK